MAMRRRGAVNITYSLIHVTEGFMQMLNVVANFEVLMMNSSLRRV
jgi:hypothetical protein